MARWLGVVVHAALPTDGDVAGRQGGRTGAWHAVALPLEGVCDILAGSELYRPTAAARSAGTDLATRGDTLYRFSLHTGQCCERELDQLSRR